MTLRLVERTTGRDPELDRHASEDGVKPLCGTRAWGGYTEVRYPETRPPTIGDVDCKRCRRKLVAARASRVG